MCYHIKRAILFNYAETGIKIWPTGSALGGIELVTVDQSLPAGIHYLIQELPRKSTYLPNLIDSFHKKWLLIKGIHYQK